MGFETEQHRRLKDATTCRLKRHGQFRPGPAVARQDVVEVGSRRARPGGDFVDGLARGEEVIFQAHVQNSNSVLLSAQGVRLPCGLMCAYENRTMAWTQVGNFKRHLAEYQKRAGRTQAQVAKELGTSYGTLRFWLSGTRQPRLATLQKISALLGCSLTELADDPGAVVGGAQPEATEFDRFLLGVVGVDVASMTLAQKQAAFTAWKAIVAALKDSKNT